MLDLTNYVELQNQINNKIILTAWFRLDKLTMINLLSQDSIFFEGNYYKVPKHTILECLLNKKYGEIYLELELI